MHLFGNALVVVCDVETLGSQGGDLLHSRVREVGVVSARRTEEINVSEAVVLL